MTDLADVGLDDEVADPFEELIEAGDESQDQTVADRDAARRGRCPSIRPEPPPTEPPPTSRGRRCPPRRSAPVLLTASGPPRAAATW